MITETRGVSGAWLFTSVQSQPRVDNYPERGARMARREERAYREYVSDEQRSQPGCPARRIVKYWLGQDTRPVITSSRARSAGARRRSSSPIFGAWDCAHNG